MGGGGGKGGGSSSVTKIPDWLRDPTIRNLERAETVQQMEYMPYTGLEVAAQTPMQQLANQQGVQAAQAFGMAPMGFDPNAGMPQTVTQGGMTGYTSFPMFQAAKAAAEAADPRSAAIREALYTAPVSTRTYGKLTAADVGGADYSNIDNYSNVPRRPYIPSDDIDSLVGVNPILSNKDS